MLEVKTKDLNVVKAFRGNLILAANRILDANVSWWQRSWFQGVNQSSISYLLASRGSGKTTFIAMYCLLRAILFPKERVGMISNSYRQAQIIFVNEMLRFLEGSPYASACVKGHVSIGLQKCEVRFHNGSSVTALPLGDGSKIRSSRFHTLVVDEFQSIDQEIIDAVVFPFLNVQKNPLDGMLLEQGDKKGKANLNKNRLIIASTAGFKHDDAYSKFDFIQRKYKEGNSEYFCSVVNLDDLRTVDGWINEEIINVSQETQSQTRFLMEYYGVWAESGAGFFNAIACENMKDINVKFLDKPRDGCKYAIGVDPAKTSSNFTVCGLEWDGERTNLFYANAFGREETDNAVGMVKYLQHQFNAMVYMDARGGGIWVADEMMKTEMSTSKGEIDIIDGIPYEMLTLLQTGHPIIDNMNWALKAGIENGKIRVPGVVDEDFKDKTTIVLNDIRADEVNELIRELQSIVQKQLEKEVQYTTENRKDLKDRYCAFMYAYWAILENYVLDNNSEDDLLVFSV
jgi:hypothetical protein